MLTPILDQDAKATGAWKHLSDGNNQCPGCGETIYCHNAGIEYSKTKRGTHVFWHSWCTEKVWR